MFLEKYKTIYVAINRVASNSIHQNLAPHADEENSELLDYSNLVSKYGKGTMSKNFVFSIVRNPYDRLVSAYFGLVKDDLDILRHYKVNTFEGFVNFALESRVDGLFDHIVAQSDLLKSQTERRDNSSVDYVGRYETLQRDFKTACDVHATPHKWLKVTNKSNRFNYRYYYNHDLRTKVRKFYQEDFETFKYKF